MTTLVLLKSKLKMIHWKTIKEYEDITFKMADGVARIAPPCEEGRKHAS